MENHLKAATVMANLLDNQFNFFGLRFGLNAIFDLVPEVGDLVAAILSFYLIWIAMQMRLPIMQMIEMVGNILINFLIGLIPIIGDATYIFRKANMKNLAILQRHANNQSIRGQAIA